MGSKPIIDSGFRCWGVCATSFLTLFVAVGFCNDFGVILQVRRKKRFSEGCLEDNIFQFISGFSQPLQDVDGSNILCWSFTWCLHNVTESSGWNCGDKNRIQMDWVCWNTASNNCNGCLLLDGQLFNFSNWIWFCHGSWALFSISPSQNLHCILFPKEVLLGNWNCCLRRWSWIHCFAKSSHSVT